nr:hypothetical protein [Tanacetum cinerariifolium]
MSDSEHFTVTYTYISSDYGYLDVGSPGVIVYGYDGLPMMPEDPYAYVEAAMKEPPPPDFVPEPVYPEFMPPEDDVFLAEEQPLPVVVSPTADSPGYITESDPEEDSEEEDDEDPEEDPTDFPTNRDDEEEEEESSEGDADDEEEDEGEDKKEEEEHLALADSVPPPAYRTTARMFIRAQRPIPFSSEVKVDRLLVIPTLPPSPLTPLSSPLPWIPSPPFLVTSPPTTIPTYIEAPLGYRAVGIRLRTSSPPPLPLSSQLPLPPPIILPRTRASMVMMRVAALSTYCLAPPSGTPPLLPIPLPTSSPPLLLPSTNYRVDVLEKSARSSDHMKSFKFILESEPNCSSKRLLYLLKRLGLDLNKDKRRLVVDSLDEEDDGVEDEDLLEMYLIKLDHPPHHLLELELVEECSHVMTHDQFCKFGIRNHGCWILKMEPFRSRYNVIVIVRLRQVKDYPEVIKSQRYLPGFCSHLDTTDFQDPPYC